MKLTICKERSLNAVDCGAACIFQEILAIQHKKAAKGMSAEPVMDREKMKAYFYWSLGFFESCLQNLLQNSYREPLTTVKLKQLSKRLFKISNTITDEKGCRAVYVHNSSAVLLQTVHPHRRAPTCG